MDWPVDDYHALCGYTLGRGDAAFVHQHVVDAWAAQTATADTKPIAVTFALAGLYLHVERGLSGRRVQHVHMQMARHGRPWPHFPLPADRGSLTASDVMAVVEGPPRDAAITAWCRSVWGAWRPGSRQALVALLDALHVDA